MSNADTYQPQHPARYFCHRLPNGQLVFTRQAEGPSILVPEAVESIELEADASEWPALKRQVWEKKLDFARLKSDKGKPMKPDSAGKDDSPPVRQ